MKYETNIWTRQDGYTISTQKQYLDVAEIHRFLSEESYWVQGISKELVQVSIDHSLCYGIYQGNPINDTGVKQVGFARVVSDFVRFSWLGDVFVLSEYRGMGLSKWLLEVIISHPYLKGTSFNLGTKDAHTLYQKYGFQALENPDNRLCRPLNWELIKAAYVIENKE